MYIQYVSYIFYTCFRERGQTPIGVGKNRCLMQLFTCEDSQPKVWKNPGTNSPTSTVRGCSKMAGCNPNR